MLAKRSRRAARARSERRGRGADIDGLRGVPSSLLQQPRDADDYSVLSSLQQPEEDSPFGQQGHTDVEPVLLSDDEQPDGRPRRMLPIFPTCPPNSKARHRDAKRAANKQRLLEIKARSNCGICYLLASNLNIDHAHRMLL